MDSLQSVLPKVLRKRGLYAHAQSAQVVHLAQQWLEQALPSLAAHVRVHTLSHATLTIACSHSIAAQECQQVAPMLREFLARECRGIAIDDVRIQRGRAEDTRYKIPFG